MRPRLGDLDRQRRAVIGVQRKHPAVRQVAVVGDGQHLSTGPRLVLGEMGPQVLGVLAVVLREGEGLVHPDRTVAEQDVAVQVVGTLGGVFAADDRREHARRIGAVGERRVRVPSVLDRLGFVDRRFLVRKRADNLHCRVEGSLRVAGGQRLVPGAPLIGRRDLLRVAGQQLWHQPVHLGVVGDDQPVQQPRQLGAQAVGGRHFLASGEAEGVLLGEPGHASGVHRDHRVQVGIYSQRPLREVASGVGREASGARTASVSSQVVENSCATTVPLSNIAMAVPDMRLRISVISP